MGRIRSHLGQSRWFALLGEPRGHCPGRSGDSGAMRAGIGDRRCRLGITPLVQAWSARSLPNHGLIIEVQDHAKGAAYFYSRDSEQNSLRPVLEVTCAMPATTPPAR